MWKGGTWPEWNRKEFLKQKLQEKNPRDVIEDDPTSTENRFTKTFPQNEIKGGLKAASRSKLQNFLRSFCYEIGQQFMILILAIEFCVPFSFNCFVVWRTKLLQKFLKKPLTNFR